MAHFFLNFALLESSLLSFSPSVYHHLRDTVFSILSFHLVIVSSPFSARRWMPARPRVWSLLVPAVPQAPQPTPATSRCSGCLMNISWINERRAGGICLLYIGLSLYRNSIQQVFVWAPTVCSATCWLPHGRKSRRGRDPQLGKQVQASGLCQKRGGCLQNHSAHPWTGVGFDSDL